MAKESPQDRSDTADRDRDALRCVACDHAITDRGHATERGGAHEHTFVNPSGVVHHIGCFLVAPGAAHVGDEQEAFSWFPGWSWQIAVCANCRAHLGWRFRCAGEEFHGLIVAALR